MAVKLFIGSLRSDVTYEQLYTFLLQYGDIAKLNLIFDKNDKDKCRGFGFVTFVSESSNKAILKETLSF